MNWLAHLVLAGPDPLARAGQLAADFLRGDELAAVAPALRPGIAAHRALDVFTDSHPRFRRSRARIGGEHARWSGVLCDVFYDHLLAAEFDHFGPGPSLGDFVRDTLAELSARQDLLPRRLRAALPRMVEEGWLTSYATVHGVRETLQRMESRLRRPIVLADATDVLERERGAFREDFAVFWFEAQSWAGLSPE
ncbi:MAG: ACP phosphodiesterase [Planctomycetota bacterium]